MVIFAIILNIVLIAIDQYTKFLAVTKLRPIGNTVFIEGVLDFTYVENRGAAFGLFQNATIFFAIFTVLVLGFIIYYFFKLPKTKEYNILRFSMMLITSGAIGNFIDRMKNRFVVDFLDATIIKFMDFPVFNMADIYVVVGSFIMCIMLMFFIKEERDNGDKI